MRAVVIDEYGDPGTVLSVRDIEQPVLRPGQVLVKIAAASINPADATFIEGSYGIRKALPTVPGLEASGTVAAANAGAYGRWLVGKRVACSAPNDGPGPWAEFMACPAASCLPLMKRVSLEQGAMLLANPLTAVSLLYQARKGGHKAIVQTAAGSALGRMIDRLGRARAVPVINIVRREEAVRKLVAEGREHVLDSSDSGFNAALRDLSARLGATIAFDVVGGELSARLASAMPHGSKIVVFGGLSGRDPRLSLPDVIFHAKSLEGFWLPLKLAQTSRLQLLRMAIFVQRNMAIFGTEVLDRLPLERVGEAVALMQSRGSDGKVLLVP